MRVGFKCPYCGREFYDVEEFRYKAHVKAAEDWMQSFGPDLRGKLAYNEIANAVVRVRSYEPCVKKVLG